MYGRLVARFLEARSLQEREERVAHAWALAFVFLAASVKYVTGLTVRDAPFTIFVVAVAASAARGGFKPAVVATLASMLVGGLGGPPPSWALRLAFAAESLAVALVVVALESRLLARDGRLATALATIGELRRRDRRRRMLDAALRHLEETAGGETAVFVLNDRGAITEWRPSAEQLYGYRADDLLGTSAAGLFFDPPPPDELVTILRGSENSGSLRRLALHRRQDGNRVEVELEVRPFREMDGSGFTVTAHDLARGREWDEYRLAATRAQAALQEAADDTRRQLAALESLTDPSLNPLEGPAMVVELLERLRAAVSADGAAIVQPGPLNASVMAAARGLQPAAGPAGDEGPRLPPGRVAVVHNDPARVAQLSGLRWPGAMASLLVVPVVYDGRVWSTIEVVSERSRGVTDFDVALVRIVADRLAAVVVQDRGLAA